MNISTAESTVRSISSCGSDSTTMNSSRLRMSPRHRSMNWRAATAVSSIVERPRGDESVEPVLQLEHAEQRTGLVERLAEARELRRGEGDHAGLGERIGAVTCATSARP